MTTVSHVLNQVPGKRIRRETRDRVRQAADELGYVVDGVARSLRTRRSQVIAMIGDEVVITPFALGIILGAQEAASKLGGCSFTSPPGWIAARNSHIAA